MKILANENIMASAVQELRDLGHDVMSVKEVMRGADDTTILARAQAEERIVVTRDKDFGELAFRVGLPATCGIILFRLSGAEPDADCRRIVAVIESRTDWVGHFAVATDDRIRMRPLPTTERPVRG